MKATQRKTIELARKKIPLRSLMHGKEIRDAASAVEQFRIKLNEQEFLYGAKITIDWADYSTVYAVARRPETDKEYADRLERLRVAEEQKKERELKRKAEAEKRKAEEEIRKRERAAEYIRKLANENGIGHNELLDILSKEQA